MTLFSVSQFFRPLSSVAKLSSVNSIDAKYSKESFGALELTEMLPLQEEFMTEVLSPRKEAKDYWETWYLHLSLLQKTAFIGILVIGYYNIEGAKFLKSKKVITINSQLQFYIGLFPVITLTKEVVKSISIYKKKKHNEAQVRKQFFTETRFRKLIEAFQSKV